MSISLLKLWKEAYSLFLVELNELDKLLVFKQIIYISSYIKIQHLKRIFFIINNITLVDVQKIICVFILVCK